MNKIWTSKPQHIYAGFDPTADSLHLGNLLILIGLVHCQRAGHNPIALIGGATGQVGDPSGRQTERPDLQIDTMHHNLSCIRKQIERTFANHEEYFWSTREQKGLLRPVKYVFITSIQYCTRTLMTLSGSASQNRKQCRMV